MLYREHLFHSNAETTDRTPATRPRSEIKYRREIDGLRALAVVPVILFHAGFSTFSGGFVGVDIFFVISGYLITGIILQALADGNFSIVDFYERRARRIMPALFFVLICSTPFVFLWMTSDAIDRYFSDLLAVSLFVSNIAFFLQVDYFAPSAELNPLLHTWSLAVEEQYYLFIPLILVVLWRYCRAGLFIVLALAAVLSLTLSEIVLYFSHFEGWSRLGPANFYLLPTRAWELLIGALCVAQGTRAVGPTSRGLLAFLGLVLVVSSIFAFDSTTPFPSLYALIPTTGTALILMYATQGTTVAALLSTRLCVGIGLVSYSAYLWHQPVFAYARMAGLSVSDIPVFAALALGIAFLAYLSWRFVETPFRDRQRFKAKTVFMFSGALLVGTAALSLSMQAVGSRNGILLREAYRGDTGSREFYEHLSGRYHACEPRKIAEKAPRWEAFVRCMQSRPSSAIDTVILGDSHAEH